MQRAIERREEAGLTTPFNLAAPEPPVPAFLPPHAMLFEGSRRTGSCDWLNPQHTQALSDYIWSRNDKLYPDQALHKIDAARLVDHLMFAIAERKQLPRGLSQTVDELATVWSIKSPAHQEAGRDPEREAKLLRAFAEWEPNKALQLPVAVQEANLTTLFQRALSLQTLVEGYKYFFENSKYSKSYWALNIDSAVRTQKKYHDLYPKATRAVERLTIAMGEKVDALRRKGQIDFDFDVENKVSFPFLNILEWQRTKLFHVSLDRKDRRLRRYIADIAISTSAEGEGLRPEYYLAGLTSGSPRLEKISARELKRVIIDQSRRDTTDYVVNTSLNIQPSSFWSVADKVIGPSGDEALATKLVERLQWRNNLTQANPDNLGHICRGISRALEVSSSRKETMIGYEDGAKKLAKKLLTKYLRTNPKFEKSWWARAQMLTLAADIVKIYPKVAKYKRIGHLIQAATFQEQFFRPRDDTGTDPATKARILETAAVNKLKSLAVSKQD